VSDHHLATGHEYVLWQSSIWHSDNVHDPTKLVLHQSGFCAVRLTSPARQCWAPNGSWQCSKDNAYGIAVEFAQKHQLSQQCSSDESTAARYTAIFVSSRISCTFHSLWLSIPQAVLALLIRAAILRWAHGQQHCLQLVGRTQNE